MGKTRMARALLIPKSGVGTRSTNGSFGSFDLYYIIYGQFTKLWKEWRHQNLSKNNNRARVSNGDFPVKIMSKTLHWRTRWGQIIYFIIFLPPFLFLSQKSWKWNGASEEKLISKLTKTIRNHCKDKTACVVLNLLRQSDHENGANRYPGSPCASDCFGWAMVVVVHTPYIDMYIWSRLHIGI